MGIYLHHDAITGTNKQIVADMYTHQMQKAIDQSAEYYDIFLVDKVAEFSGVNITGGLK